MAWGGLKLTQRIDSGSHASLFFSMGAFRDSSKAAVAEKHMETPCAGSSAAADNCLCEGWCLGELLYAVFVDRTCIQPRRQRVIARTTLMETLVFACPHGSARVCQDPKATCVVSEQTATDAEA